MSQNITQIRNPGSFSLNSPPPARKMICISFGAVIYGFGP